MYLSRTMPETSLNQFEYEQNLSYLPPEYKPSDFFGPPSLYQRLPEDVSDAVPAATRPKRPVSPGVAPGPLRSATEERPVHHIIAADAPFAAGGRPAAASGTGPAAPSGTGPAAPSERGQLPHVAALEQENVNEGRSSDSFFIGENCWRLQNCISP